MMFCEMTKSENDFIGSETAFIRSAFILTLKLYHQTCYSLIRSILVGTKIVIFVETKAKYHDY